jgi:hypothetical protein
MALETELLIDALGAVPRVLVWDGEGAIGRWRGKRSELTADCQGFRGTLATKVLICRPADPVQRFYRVDVRGGDRPAVDDPGPGAVHQLVPVQGGRSHDGQVGFLPSPQLQPVGLPGGPHRPGRPGAAPGELAGHHDPCHDHPDLRGLHGRLLAGVDGASHLRIFRSFVLPLSLPAIASFGIFQFLWVWNDLLVAKTFGGTSPDMQPVTARMQTLLGSYGSRLDLIAPAGFLTIVIPLIVFLSLQR